MWASVTDGGPTLTQPWFKASCRASMKYWLGLNGYWPAPVTFSVGLYSPPTVTQQTRDIDSIQVQCVADGGPALDQHWVNVVFAGSVDKPHCVSHIGVVPKQNNKFPLIHSLYCPQEPFNNINYKSHRHYTSCTSYQPLWLCCWRGDISSFLFTKN